MQFTTVRAKLQEENTTSPAFLPWIARNKQFHSIWIEEKTFPAYDAHYGALFCNLMLFIFCLMLMKRVRSELGAFCKGFTRKEEEGRLIDAGNRGKFDGCLSRFLWRTFFKRRCFVEKAFWQWSLMCIDCFFSSNYRSEWITTVNGVT